MAREIVVAAIKQLEKAINDGEHNCDVYVEDLGESKEVCFYLDNDDDEPAAVIVVIPA